MEKELLMKDRTICEAGNTARKVVHLAKGKLKWLNSMMFQIIMKNNCGTITKRVKTMER